MNNKKISWVILSLIALVFTFAFYGKIILHPNDYLFSNSGDGIKNYYTYYYHIVHGTSYVNFTGMNYPYGEHFLYTDCHPLLANTLKFISGGKGFFADNSIGILNFLMIASIFFTFIVVYRLLLEFAIQRYIAILYAVGITLLAPQIFRLTGHLALSYSFAIPLSWLLLIKFIKTEKTSYGVLNILNALFWFFIHAYLGMMVVFIQSLYLIINFISNRSLFRKKAFVLFSFLIIILPTSIFFSFAKITDTHVDRTDNPSGFFLYRAELDDVLIPSHPPLRPILDKMLGPVINIKWESWCYVGLPVVLLLLSLLVLGVVRLFNRNKAKILLQFFDNRILNISLIASLFILLFSMAVPFQSFPKLLDVFPIVKQFRATGRFTWPFYFVITTFCVYAMHKCYLYFSDKGKKHIGLTLIILSGSLFVIEGLPYHTAVKHSITSSLNLFEKGRFSKDYTDGIDLAKKGNYQAIFTLPFFYHGSETYSRPRVDNAIKHSIIISSQTGLPMFGASLTRTSVTESKKIVQLGSPGFYPRLIKTDLTDNRPFLIIKTKDPLSKYEETILSQAKLLYSGNDITLYSIEKEAFFKNPAAEYFDMYEKQKTKLVTKNGFLVSDASDVLFYDNFDTKASNITFRGKGAFKSIKKDKNTFAEFNQNTFAVNKEYEVSIWMYNNMKDALNEWFRFIIEEYDAKNNTWHETTFYPESAETINGDWSLVEGKFTVHDPANKIFIVTKGAKDSKAELFADDLLVKEVNNNVYKLENDSTLFYNNHEIKRK